jgi:hypothetical protein
MRTWGGSTESPQTGHPSNMANLVKFSVALFVATELFIFALIGVDSLPLIGGWALAALIVALCGWLVHETNLRVFGAALLIPVCLVFVTFLGLFFLPSVVVLLISAVRGRHRGAEEALPHQA